MEAESLHARRPALFAGLRARTAVGSIRKSFAVLASAALLAPVFLGAAAAHAEPETPVAEVAAGTPTPLAIVLPITVPQNETGLLSSEELADYTGATGSLTRLLDAALNRSVALAIDPMIIVSIRVLGTSAPSTATSWLERLANASNETFALPYADADVSAQVQSGLTTLLAPTSFAFALSDENFANTAPTPTPGAIDPVPAATPNAEPGEESTEPSDAPVLPTMEELLSWPYTLGGIAWPATNTVGAATPAVLATNGYGSTIIAESNLVAVEKGAESASARAGDNALLVADTELTDALDEAVSAKRESDWQIAMTHANDVIAAASASGTTRSLLATLPRSWPNNPSALSATISALEQNTAASVEPLSAIQALPASEVVVADLGESSERLGTIGALLGRETELAGFSTALADPASLTGPERLRILALLGVSWLANDSEWRSAVNNNLQRSYEILHSVTVVPSNTVLVVGGAAQFPVTVQNNFTEPVTLRVSLTPSNGRLVVDESVEATIEAGSSGTVLVPVSARVGNGMVSVTVTLTTSAGVQLEAPVTIPVDVRADWEGIGAALLGTAILLFFGFGIFRNIRRQRRERAAAAAESDSGTDSDTDIDETESDSVKPVNEVTPPDAAEPESPRG